MTVHFRVENIENALKDNISSIDLWNKIGMSDVK